jgi:predicted secreted Zn-dependent protease
MTLSFTRTRPFSITTLPAAGAAVLCLVVTGLALWPGPVSAEVREVVTYRSYPVSVAPGDSLASAVARATPIRPRWWQRFHGLAAWNVAWTYRQEVQEGGRCEATDVQVEVVTEITLPELVAAPAADRKVFETYLEALRTHELGHHAIALAAGQRVLAVIRGAGAWPDCAALDAEVVRLTDRAIGEAKSADRQYDTDTGYGRTQGAYLER